MCIDRDFTVAVVYHDIVAESAAAAAAIFFTVVVGTDDSGINYCTRCTGEDIGTVNACTGYINSTMYSVISFFAREIICTPSIVA